MKVLLIYQNETSKPFLTRIEKAFARATYRRRGISLELVTNAPIDGQAPVLARVVDSIQRSDLAVALLTADPRPASAAGNLWLEIGLWYGLKGGIAGTAGKSILFLRLPDPKNAVEVKATSDLGDSWFESVESEDQVVSQIAEFVLGRPKRKQASRVVDEVGRVKRTIGASKETWDDVRRTHCSTVRDVCKFRPPSARLIAELLQERYVNGEIAEIVFALRGIARQCDETIRQINGKLARRSEVLRRMAEAIRVFFELGKPMLQPTSQGETTRGAKRATRVSSSKNEDELGRLRRSRDAVLALVSEWLESTARHIHGQDHDHAVRAIAKLPGFGEWALGVVANQVNETWGSMEADDVPELGGAGSALNTQLAQFETRGYQAAILARLLTLGGERFFRLTSDGLSSEFLAYEAKTQSLGEMLNRAADALPHNKDVWMNIWERAR